MALQSSGAISLNDMHVEVGGTSGTTCSLNDSDIRGLIGKASGATSSFNQFYGASSGQFLIPRNNGAGNYSNLTRTVGGTTYYTETGFIGSTAMYNNTSPYAIQWAANQGSLSSTSFPGGNTIAGMVFFANPGGIQVYLYVNGGTTNTGFGNLTLSAYGSSYQYGTKLHSTSMNRTAASFSSTSTTAWTRYFYWSNSTYTGDNVFSVLQASLSSAHTGNGVELVFT